MINSKEKLELDNEILDRIITSSGGDVRNAINTLQVYLMFELLYSHSHSVVSCDEALWEEEEEAIEV